MMKINSKFISSIVLSACCLGYAFGQNIIYTDIPDITISSTGTENGAVDLNGDGTNDFNFKTAVVDTSISGTPVNFKGTIVTEAEDANKIIGRTTDLLGQKILTADGLSKDDTIGPNETFINTKDPSVYPMLSLYIKGTYALGNIGVGDFNTADDSFIGVKFTIGGDPHYGWIRVNISKDGLTCIVKDHAYYDEPNKLILAGQSSTVNIHEHSTALDANIFSSQQELRIDLKEYSAQVDVKVHSLLGEVVKSSSQMAGKKLKLSVADLRTGVYLVKVNSETKHITKKIFIQ